MGNEAKQLISIILLVLVTVSSYIIYTNVSVDTTLSYNTKYMIYAMCVVLIVVALGFCFDLHILCLSG